MILLMNQTKRLISYRFKSVTNLNLAYKLKSNNNKISIALLSMSFGPIIRGLEHEAFNLACLGSCIFLIICVLRHKAFLSLKHKKTNKQAGQFRHAQTLSGPRRSLSSKMTTEVESK